MLHSWKHFLTWWPISIYLFIYIIVKLFLPSEENGFNNLHPFVLVCSQNSWHLFSWDHPLNIWRSLLEEDMERTWPPTGCLLNWTWAVGGYSPLPVFGVFVLPTIPVLTAFPVRSLERVGCWDHLNCIHDWTPQRPTYTLLRLWWLGAEIYSFCRCPEQVSYVSSLAC